MSDTVTVTLSNSGASNPIEIQKGTRLGDIRLLSDQLEVVGAPSSYNLAVGGVAQDEEVKLQGGEVITFRPVAGNKG